MTKLPYTLAVALFTLTLPPPRTAAASPSPDYSHGFITTSELGNVVYDSTNPYT